MGAVRTLIGDRAYADLPEAVRVYNDTVNGTFIGAARSGGADHVFARLLRRLFGFPVVAERLDVELRRSVEGGREVWRRRFGDRRFMSRFSADRDGVLNEIFSPFQFGFRLRPEADRLYWDFERWSLGPLPLPKALGPRIVTYETEAEDGGYEFYSQADFPVLGRLIEYHGVIRKLDA